jgi:hypothetical protein
VPVVVVVVGEVVVAVPGEVVVSVLLGEVVVVPGTPVVLGAVTNGVADDGVAGAAGAVAVVREAPAAVTYCARAVLRCNCNWGHADPDQSEDGKQTAHLEELRVCKRNTED